MGFLGCCFCRNREVIYRQRLLHLDFLDSEENSKKLLTSIRSEFLQISSYREHRNHIIGSVYSYSIHSFRSCVFFSVLPSTCSAKRRLRKPLKMQLLEPAVVAIVCQLNGA